MSTRANIILGASVWLIALLYAAPSLAIASSRLVYARSAGAEHCPDESSVRAAVTRRLGYDPFFPTATKTIIAKIRAEAEVLHGEVELVDEQGRSIGLRTLTVPTAQCDELVHALALAISIAIDPESADTYLVSPESTPEDPPSQNNEPEPQPAPPPGDAKPEKPVRRAQPKPDAPLTWSLGLGLGGTYGLAPRPTLGVRGFVAVGLSELSLVLEGHYDPPQSTTLHRAELDVSSLRGGLLPCWVPSPLRFCAAFEVGRLEIASAAGDSGGAGLALSSGLRAGVDVAVTSRFSLRVQADVLATLVRVAVRVGPEEVWRAPPLSGAASIVIPFDL